MLTYASDLMVSMPREQSMYFAELDPDSGIGFSEVLLRKMVFNLDILVWRETKAAKGGRNKPQMFPLPSQIIAESKETKKAKFEDGKAKMFALLNRKRGKIVSIEEGARYTGSESSENKPGE